jgi:predicted Zn-dependent protease with MMP-like domain
MAGVVDIAREEFEDLVADALDQIPPELTRLMDNVVITVEDESPDGLLGLYEGIPLTERGDGYFGVLPDQIFVFRLNICSICETPEQVVEEVLVTVVHEIAHHFGIDDARLGDLGWG